MLKQPTFKNLRWMAAVAAAGFLTACATGPEPHYARDELSGSNHYVNQVVGASRSQGIDVYWVNPPRSRDSAESAETVIRLKAKDDSDG
ncbi:MAG: hypothetical protein RQ741_01890 [Wenzhouxiangellaceae bacterium]|nr:hypothetical protein [Wenzhouxiangellaceae bacterium]